VLSVRYRLEFHRDVVQAVSRRPPTGVARIRSSASLCGICGEQSDTRIDFSPITLVSPVTKIPLMLYAHLHLLLLLPEAQQGEFWEHSRTQCFFRKLNRIGFKNSVVKPRIGI